MIKICHITIKMKNEKGKSKVSLSYTERERDRDRETERERRDRDTQWRTKDRRRRQTETITHTMTRHWTKKQSHTLTSSLDEETVVHSQNVTWLIKITHWTKKQLHTAPPSHPTTHPTHTNTPLSLPIQVQAPSISLPPNSKHRFTTAFLLEEECQKTRLGVCLPLSHSSPSFSAPHRHVNLYRPPPPPPRLDILWPARLAGPADYLIPPPPSPLRFAVLSYSHRTHMLAQK